MAMRGGNGAEMDEMEREHLEDAAKLKESLRTARPRYFQIIRIKRGSGETHWAANLYGCHDIAWFICKCDAELFVKA